MNIRKYGDPILRAKCQEIKNFIVSEFQNKIPTAPCPSAQEAGPDRPKSKIRPSPFVRKGCPKEDSARAKASAYLAPEIKQLAEDMLETMHQAGGVGLAGPQIGKNWRIIVADINQEPMALVNPEILEKSKELVAGEEGCLSLPGLIFKIKRPRWVVVEGCRPDDGQKIKIKAEGLLACVLQHEIDHLDGILILDHIPFWQRWLAIKKIKH